MDMSLKNHRIDEKLWVLNSTNVVIFIHTNYMGYFLLLSSTGFVHFLLILCDDSRFKMSSTILKAPYFSQGDGADSPVLCMQTACRSNKWGKYRSGPSVFCPICPREMLNHGFARKNHPQQSLVDSSTRIIRQINHKFFYLNGVVKKCTKLESSF